MITLVQINTPMDCSVSELFDYVTNMENYAEWFPGVHKITSGNDKSHGQVGKTYIESLTLPTGIAKLIIAVKKVQSNKLFITEGDLEYLLPMMTMEFQSLSDERCYFQLTYSSRNPKLDEKTVTQLQSDLNVRTIKALENLKSILELEVK